LLLELVGTCAWHDEQSRECSCPTPSNVSGGARHHISKVRANTGVAPRSGVDGAPQPCAGSDHVLKTRWEAVARQSGSRSSGQATIRLTSCVTVPPASRSIPAWPAGVTRRMTPTPAVVKTRAPSLRREGPPSLRWSSSQLCRPLHLREATEPREEPDQRVLEAEFFCDLVPVRLGARGAEVQHQRHHVVLGLAQPGNAGKEEDVRESQRDFQPADDGPAKQKGISLGDDRG